MDKKICQTCGKKFSKGKYDVPSRWEQRKICSQACRRAWNSGLNEEDPRVAKNIQNLKKHSFKKGDTSGKLNTNWKGDEASYYAKHIWVNNQYGKPGLCERCGTQEDRIYQWANISKEFKRERSDWMRLCIPCHKRFDLARSDYTVVRSDNQSGVRGVQLVKPTGTWRATITIDKKTHHLGYYKDKKDAIEARRKAEQELR